MNRPDWLDSFLGVTGKWNWREFQMREEPPTQHELDKGLEELRDIINLILNCFDASFHACLGSETFVIATHVKDRVSKWTWKEE